MPALYTHYVFGQHVLTKLNKDLQNDIKENISYYNMFNQGFDNLYYYLFKWNYYRHFGIKCHKKNIPLFFKNALLYIKDHHLENNSICTNMIYGILNHYTLDTYIHPFINSQVKHLNIPHTKMEFIIDAHLYRNLNNTKWHNKIYKTLIPKLKFPNELINLLDYTFLNTYNEPHIGHIYNTSHNTGYYVYRYFINDYYGIKAKIYKIADFILRRDDITFSESTFRVKESNTSIFNLDNNIWHHPSNYQKTYHYSFKDLYEYSLKKATKLNNMAYLVIHNNLDINKLLEEIKLINIDNI